MLLIKLLFVAASLIGQAYMFSEAPARAETEASAVSAASPDTAGTPSLTGADRSPAESDSTPTQESCALR